MKIFIVVLIIAVAGFLGWKSTELWQESKAKAHETEVVEVHNEYLSGMEGSLETPLQNARARGASGLRDFLRQYGRRIQDPKLAAIQLDYVVLVAQQDLGEARKVFSEVKNRVPSSSPVYPRIKQLEKTYQ